MDDAVGVAPSDAEVGGPSTSSQAGADLLVNTPDGPSASSAGADALINFAKTRQTYVRLEHMQLGDLGAEALAEELRKGTGSDRLKSLYLSSNSIGDVGAYAIASGLRGRPRCRLKYVYMDGNNAVGRKAANELQAVCDRRGITLIGLGTSPSQQPAPVHQPVPQSGHPILPAAPAMAPPPQNPPAVPPPAHAELLPCNRSAAPRARSAAAVRAASEPSFLPVARLHRGAPKATSVPRGEALSGAPRYRATRPAGPDVQHQDAIACARTKSFSGGVRSGGGGNTDIYGVARHPMRQPVQTQESGDAAKPPPRSRASRAINPLVDERRELERGLLERRRKLEREAMGQTKDLLDHTRERQVQLKNAPMAHRIPWWQRADPR